jgi:polysaccharide pyruvyl transferase WcaK-like protein
MNILLIGANFKNKGAEAMALTAVRELAERHPEARFTVASYAAKESRPYGEHTETINERTCAFRLIKNRKDVSTFVRIIGSLIPSHALRRRIVAGNDYLTALCEADIVIDLSGFALTDKRPLYRRVVFVSEILTAKIFGKPFIVFTQALGPFDRPASKVLAKIGLPLTDLVCARGESTVAHLESIGLARTTKVIRCADSAYLFRPTPNDRPLTLKRADDPRPIIGIVPNTNVYERARVIAGENSYSRLLAATIDHATESLGARVVFICHEHYEDRKDDRWLAGEAVRLARHGRAIEIISGERSASELKTAIGEVDLLIASRFHSLVAANSLAVPSIAVAWAHKYHELFAEAGVPELVFDATDLDAATFLPQLDSAWARRAEIHRVLVAHHEPLMISARKAFDAVGEVLRG